MNEQAKEQRQRAGSRGPVPISDPRGSLTMWAYPKAGEVALLERAEQRLIASGAVDDAGMRLRDGRLSPSDLAVLLSRFFNKCKDTNSFELVTLETGVNNKKIKISLNNEEARDWGKACDAAKDRLERGVECSPRLVLLSLASFFVNHCDTQ